MKSIKIAGTFYDEIYSKGIKGGRKMKKGLFVLAHGSKNQEAQETLKEIMLILEKENEEPFDLLGFGSLQFSQPDFTQGINQLVDQGAEQIVIVPMFLFQGNHVKYDIPEVLEKLQKKHDKVQFILANQIGADLRIADIIQERAKEALQIQF